MLDFSPDALIAAPVFQQETREMFDRCQERGIPFVSLNDNLHHPGQISYIGQDPGRSGAVAAQLLNLGTRGKGRLLIVSIAGERDNYHHIRNREEGFREYCMKSGQIRSPRILSLAIQKQSSAFVKKALGELFEQCGDIRGIFVTNSRVYQVARFLVETNRQEIMLVGYDLIDPNVRYLNKGIIDFLISQKPREQGYKALVSLFNSLRTNKQPSAEQHIPIDIICRENLCCYQV